MRNRLSGLCNSFILLSVCGIFMTTGLAQSREPIRKDDTESKKLGSLRPKDLTHPEKSKVILDLMVKANDKRAVAPTSSVIKLTSRNGYSEGKGYLSLKGGILSVEYL